jgi:hypothetical protein
MPAADRRTIWWRLRHYPDFCRDGVSADRMIKRKDGFMFRMTCSTPRNLLLTAAFRKAFCRTESSSSNQYLYLSSAFKPSRLLDEAMDL